MPAPASTFTIRSPRGHDLAARMERPPGHVRATALFAHCFTCTKDFVAARRIVSALAEQGIAVLSFDFTGLGSSGGDFATSDFSTDVEDLVAAAAHLAGEIAEPSLLVGHSLGGAAVLSAAARLPSVAAVATVAAPADVTHLAELFGPATTEIEAHGRAQVDIAGRTFTVGSEFLEDLRQHRLLKVVESLDAALLFLHAPHDRVVGIDNARRLFEAARHPKSFVTLDDADHLLTDESDARYAANVIASWAARYLPPVTTESSYDDTVAVATNRNGLTADVNVRGFSLRVDEPAAVGGTETGPTPYDYLGAALAACTSITLRMYADRKDMNLDEVVTEVAFERVHADDCADCEHRDGRIERFQRTISLEGALSDADRQRLLAIANRCPVHRTLDGQIEVHTTLNG